MTLLSSVLVPIITAVGLSFPNITTSNQYLNMLIPDITPKTGTIISLDIPWESGDVFEVTAEPPPPPTCTDKEELVDNKCVPLPEPEPVVEEVKTKETTSEPTSTENINAKAEKLYSLKDLMFHGVINWEGFKYTFYSEGVLPGPGLSIPGRHVNEDGYVSDNEGYIALAAPFGIPKGTIYPTPFGHMGKVYDQCASCTTSPSLWLDVYTK